MVKNSLVAWQVFAENNFLKYNKTNINIGYNQPIKSSKLFLYPWLSSAVASSLRAADSAVATFCCSAFQQQHLSILTPLSTFYNALLHSDQWPPPCWLWSQTCTVVWGLFPPSRSFLISGEAWPVVKLSMHATGGLVFHSSSGQTCKQGGQCCWITSCVTRPVATDLWPDMSTGGQTQGGQCVTAIWWPRACACPPSTPPQSFPLTRPTSTKKYYSQHLSLKLRCPSMAETLHSTDSNVGLVQWQLWSAYFCPRSQSLRVQSSQTAQCCSPVYINRVEAFQRGC